MRSNLSMRYSAHARPAVYSRACLERPDFSRNESSECEFQLQETRVTLVPWVRTHRLLDRTRFVLWTSRFQSDRDLSSRPSTSEGNTVAAEPCTKRPFALRS